MLTLSKGTLMTLRIWGGVGERQGALEGGRAGGRSSDVKGHSGWDAVNEYQWPAVHSWPNTRRPKPKHARWAMSVRRIAPGRMLLLICCLCKHQPFLDGCVPGCQRNGRLWTDAGAWCIPSHPQAGELDASQPRWQASMQHSNTCH